MVLRAAVASHDIGSATARGETVCADAHGKHVKALDVAIGTTGLQLS
jgi:hypothetical protein